VCISVVQINNNCGHLLVGVEGMKMTVVTTNHGK